MEELMRWAYVVSENPIPAACGLVVLVGLVIAGFSLEK